MADSPLDIAAVRAWPVRVERLERFRPRTAKGSPTHSEYAIVEIETASGVMGLGEVTCSVIWNGEEAAGSVDLIQRVLAPRLIGTRVDDWPATSTIVDSTFRNRPFLRAAIEMACLDAEGIAADVPVAALLGGIRRSTFATKFVLPARDPDFVADMATTVVALGAEALKVKVGLVLSEDVQRLEAVRANCGSLPLSVDANEGWDPADSDTIARALEPSQLVAVEQPFNRRAVEATARMRRAMDVAFVGDESIWNQADLSDATTSGAFSAVSIYPGKVGGLRRCLQLATAARDAGLDVTFGSNLELGIGAAAMAHTMAAAPMLSAVVASDLIGPLYFASSLVHDDSFVTFSGATLPTGAGLGVRLDRDALAEHTLAPA